MARDGASFATSFHRTHHRLVLAITGGGSEAVARLLGEPGASRTVLEAVIPYSAVAMDRWLGRTPESYCAPAVARAMAMEAWQRACELTALGGDLRGTQAGHATLGAGPHAPGGSTASGGLVASGGLAAAGGFGATVGLGATASLVSERPKRGPHRIHVAVQTSPATFECALELEKGARTRQEEEEVATRLILYALAEACDVEAAAMRLALGEMLLPGERVSQRLAQAAPGWPELLLGIRTLAEVAPDGVGPAVSRQSPVRIVFPGSFHPLHDGHLQMARFAEQWLGTALCWELSVANVDKLPLDFLSIRERLDEIALRDGRRSIWLTAAPTFVEKAALFPGAVFVVGIDTLARIGETRYYADQETQRDAALRAISERGCRFLVFGRQAGGRFRTLNEVGAPQALVALCDEVPEAEFRLDISSTELRQRIGGGPG